MPKSSKYASALDQLSEDEIDRPEDTEYFDARLFDAIKAVATVIQQAANKPEPKEKEEADYTKPLETIAKMIASINAASEIKALRSDLGGIAASIATLKSADLSAIVTAIDKMAASQRALHLAMTAPRVLTYDANGEPNGLRIERVN
jgi:hypothetical protein